MLVYKCIEKNSGDEGNCSDIKDVMLECGVGAFRIVNKAVGYEF